LSDARDVFRLLSDVRELRADPVAARKRIADGLVEMTGAVHGFTLDLEGMTPGGTLVSRQMVVGGHPDEKGLAYLIESQRENHFRTIDPTTDWACRCRATQAAARQNDMFPRSVWMSHPYFNQHYRPAGLGPLMIGFYRRERFDNALGFSLARSRGARNFSRRDLARLELFVAELVDLRRRGLFDPPHHQLLTERERDVLRHLLDAATVKEIAKRMGISRYTADDHVKAIYRRLGVHSRAQLLSCFLLPPEQRTAPRIMDGETGPIVLP